MSFIVTVIQHGHSGLCYFNVSGMVANHILLGDRGGECSQHFEEICLVNIYIIYSVSLENYKLVRVVH